eukprot:TRINITY_DN12366_c0_g1_i2.p5 TRINITY_DN12366_c0_g1~~TRINITY_DN12366_c0_g1_i2.p5  ORF type:complete len:166 (+),score=22.51 TRINITY_DN12366_c0_g1_i2:1601-2098(+)
MKQDLIKQKVQGWIVLFSLLILIGKFIAFYVTNSVGILTDAMESIVNVIAGLISFISLRYAAKPKDKGHPFGHGKIELISASIEGLLIMIAGGMIIYEGIRRLFEPATIGKLDIGIAVVAVAPCTPVSYTHLRAHETRHDLVCRLLLEKKKKKTEHNKSDTNSQN